MRCYPEAPDPFPFVFFLIGSLLLLFPHPAEAQNLTVGQINVISTRLAESALQSWELGTRSQAILELNATAYSVFSSTSLPPPATIPSDLITPLEPFFAIARSVVSNLTAANNNTVGPQPLIPNDGSAADPASIGMCVLLANWTKQDAGQIDYAGAAKDQLDFLFQDVPMTSDGAISHRVSEVQLWSDFVYMIPPFLAYYGVTLRNRTLLAESYTQIMLYRNYLRDPTQNMWRHVLLGNNTSGTPNDEGFWSTGNAWAAAGILRVLATIRQSEFANTFSPEQANLSSWVEEIHSGMYAHLGSENLFTNYADQPSTFLDAASTALLASTVYRAAVMLKQYTYIPFAEKTRQTLMSASSNATLPTSNSSSSFDGYNHLTSDGRLTPVVDPDSYSVEGQDSPEAEAFMVELHSAWRDWVLDGSKVSHAVRSSRLGPETVGAWAVGTVSMLVMMVGAIAI